MNNIASLAEALEKLGFDASLRYSISILISLQLSRFSLSHKVSLERDVIRFNLFFERKDTTYSCLCYDAFLRKEIVLPDIIIAGIQLKKLDKEMSVIDWKNVFNEPQEIASVINDLQTLGSTEGKEYSEQLKVKYWSDTLLETVMNISILKPKYEIGQRFYLFEDGKGISIEEAYRFLNNKWMERQLRKKVSPAPAEVKPGIKSKTKKSKSSKS